MSALARLINPPQTTPVVQAAHLDGLHKCVSQLGELSRNYQHLSHERRQRFLATLHVQLRDLHEAMATTATNASTF
ncbi:MAG: hypothetical protein ACREPE_15045 [Lysobacter sp.]